MKLTYISALLVGSAFSIKVSDAPSFDDQAVREVYPMAAGLLQFDEASEERKPKCEWDAEGNILNGPVKTHCKLPKCKWDAEGNLSNGPKNVRCELPICNGTNGSVEAGTCRAAGG